MTESIRVGSPTPWGRADNVEVLAPGVVVVDTASHGGIHLDEEQNNRVPVAFRALDNWYEEDCEVNIAVAAIPEAFAGRLHPDKGLEQVHDALAYWFPAKHRRAYPEEAAKRAGRETSDDKLAAIRAEIDAAAGQ